MLQQQGEEQVSAQPPASSSSGLLQGPFACIETCLSVSALRALAQHFFSCLPHPRSTPQGVFMAPLVPQPPLVLLYAATCCSQRICVPPSQTWGSR